MKLHALLPKPWLLFGLAAALWGATTVAPLHAQSDDFGDTAATATFVNLNTTTPGVLNSIVDVDYFRVMLPEAARLVVYTTGTVDTVGSLRQSGDQEIAWNDDNDTDANFRIESDVPAGTYYVRVSGFAGAVGAYSLRVETTVLAGDDHGNTLATATQISPNSTTSGVLNPANDADYFRIDLPAPATLFLTTTGAIDTIGRLHDSNDQLIATNDNDGVGLNFRIQEELGPGTYYVIVIGTGLVGPYVLTVQASIRPIVPTVTTSAVTNIALTSATFGGTVTSGGGASVTQRGVVYGTSPNPIVGSPAFVTINSGGGTGAFSASSAALAPGTSYFARAFAVNSAGVGYGDTVEFSTPDDHGGSAPNATPISVNTSVGGILTAAGDVDYFRVVFAQPVHLVVSTTGGVDTVGSLRDANDQEISGADGGGSGANFRIAQNISAGTYYIRVAGAGGATGNYTLRLEATTIAAVVTASPADVAPFGATLGGTITSDGGTAVTQRGVVYGTQQNPTLADALSVLSGSGTGSFSANVSLVPETVYFARAFAVNTAGIAYGNEVQLTTPSGSRIVNLSLRVRAGDGEQSLLMGFNLAGTGSKQLLLRGIGPALTAFGVAGALPDPFLQLFSPFTAIASNEDWGGNAAVAAASTSVGAFALPAGSRDAAMLQTLPAGTYTARVGGGNGMALVELYDAGPVWTPRLINVSTRTQIGAGAEILIAGFAIAGVGEKTVLIRAIGPTLATFQVAGVLADPRIDIYRSGTAASISANDNWGGSAALRSAFERVGAFALPTDSRDAAVLVTLPVGSYTVQVSGVGGGTGVVLMEIYEM